MKTIGIDARFYGKESRGLGRYTKMLLKHLELIDQKNHYIIYLGNKNFDEYEPQNPHFTKKRVDIPWYSLKEQIVFPFLLDSKKIDLMHFPHFNMPLAYNAPFVVTIHDLILLEYPTNKATRLDPVRYAFKNFGYKIILRKSIQDSRKIITVSNFTKRDILRHFPSVKAKIEVIYEACEQYGASCDRPNDRVKSSSDKTQNYTAKIKGPYILYVGGAYPHKNLENLVQAFRVLKKSRALNNVSLVLAGGDDFFYRRVKGIVVKERIPDVLFPGLVSDDSLAELYREAHMFVFPSFYEGFGLPPLEAMAHGIPVVSSSAGSLPEILDTAACYFNPYDIEDIARAIKKVFLDQHLRNKLINKGATRIQDFSWEKTAAETLAVYESIIGT